MLFPYEMENKARQQAQSMGRAVFAGVSAIDKIPPSGVPMSVYYPRKRGFRMLIEELTNESSRDILPSRR